MSCWDGAFWGPEKEVDVGDFGAPKAVMNDITTQGDQCAIHCLTPTWLTSRTTHFGGSKSFEP